MATRDVYVLRPVTQQPNTVSDRSSALRAAWQRLELESALDHARADALVGRRRAARARFLAALAAELGELVRAVLPEAAELTFGREPTPDGCPGLVPVGGAR